MKSTLIVLLATVALAGLLGPRALDAIHAQPRADAGSPTANQDAEGTAFTAKDRKRRDRKARRNDDDDD